MDPITVLPHRYLFLLVDRLDAVDARKSARGPQLVTGSASAIVGGRGHASVCAMPLILIVETVTQLCGAIGYFLGLNHGHLLSVALPGDMRSRAAVLRSFRRGIGRTFAVAPVGARRIVRAALTSVRRPAQPPDVYPRIVGVRHDRWTERLRTATTRGYTSGRRTDVGSAHTMRRTLTGATADGRPMPRRNARSATARDSTSPGSAARRTCASSRPRK